MEEMIPASLVIQKLDEIQGNLDKQTNEIN